MNHSKRLATLVVLAGIAASTFAEGLSLGDPAVVDQIIQEGKNHSRVMTYLKDITGKIGPRLTGSPNLSKAEKWCMDQFKKMGCTNVHLEKWGEVPVGFSRGPLQVARMVEPFESEMVFTTPSWTNGTKGLVKAKVVACPATPEAIEAAKDTLKGAWVLMAPPAAPGGGRPSPGAASGAATLREALAKAGAVGTISGSRSELVITSGTWREKTYENHPGIPQVMVRKSDYERLSRNVAYGRNVVVEIGAENRWHKGPVDIHNVVAEIKGTEKPDEVVIVSGHLDSWDGPGSQGALDNGTGTSTALEAARILNKVGAKPKRTIRFILWTGEEQGLFGSTEYVKQHEKELANISAVLVDDGGTNYQGGYEGIESQKDLFEAAFAPTNKAFPDLPMKFAVSARMPRGGGSDHAPFNRVGVPGFFTIETGRSDYNFVHHTQHDRYEMAIPEYLVQSATNHAVVAYNLACAPMMVPRQAPAPSTTPSP